MAKRFGDSLLVTRGVRQGGVLFSYLFALYIDSPINSLRISIISENVTRNLNKNRFTFDKVITDYAMSCFSLSTVYCRKLAS